MAVDYTTQGLRNELRGAFALSIVSSAAPAINTDAFSKVDITAQATALNLSTNLTGTPNDLDTLVIRVRDNGTPAVITPGTSFEAATGISLPLTTTANKATTFTAAYESADAKWIINSVSTQA